MFVIVMYDVHVKRVAKVLKTCRRYLYWVQNSVLEGEISKADFAALKRELAEIISPDHDSVLFYTFRTTRYTSRESIGMQKGGEESVPVSLTNAGPGRSNMSSVMGLVKMPGDRRQAPIHRFANYSAGVYQFAS
ncbi:CRISPR-associated endonuclease Cas2 [Alicyclobacillus suci]|uniref:CRISPR-associated endonuclease Cas2 n=1 Tax=Alicyclobacillus suci TaxID=2816080 RepID=UPI001A8F32B2